MKRSGRAKIKSKGINAEGQEKTDQILNKKSNNHRPGSKHTSEGGLCLHEKQHYCMIFFSFNLKK